mgnify:FL=1
MIFKKIKKHLQENKKLHKINNNVLKELDWANVYHDSIRGKQALENLGLNIGRWAGSYPFFYVLNRILNDYKPKNIIEFGLGESSKFISTYVENYLQDSNHFIIEQDEDWKNIFISRFQLTNKSVVKILPIEKKNIKDYTVNCYKDIDKNINQKFDLYIVDGPFGSDNYSRYDIVLLTEKLTANDEFIIIIDDYDREGEKQTVDELIKMFNQKNINIHKGIYSGVKSVLILASEKYKYIKSL